VPLVTNSYSPFLKGTDGLVYSSFRTSTYDPNSIELINIQYGSCASVPCNPTPTPTPTITPTPEPPPTLPPTSTPTPTPT
jgi:hypothetical protein